MSLTIRTNNVPRPIINAWELTPEERKEFDYLDWEAIEDGRDSASFFRYRGELYDLSEFVRIVPQGGDGGPFAHYDHTGELSGWDGIRTDSFFSGIVVRYPRLDNFRRRHAGGPWTIDSENVIVGLLLA